MLKAIIIVFSAIFILSFQVLADNDSVEEVHSLNSDYEVIGETGFVEVAQQERELWYKVNLNKSYKNPVVIMKPLSYAGIDPVHIRLKGVGSNGFQFQLEEWDYTNNFHKKERVSYLVLESGKYILRDGRQIEAGSFLLQKTKIRTQVINNKVDLANWENISFDSNWKQKPIIFTQIQTNRDSTSVKTRNARVSASSFYTILEKQENWTKSHRAKERLLI